MTGFTRIAQTFGDDLQGFTRLWERICKGFTMIHETLRQDLRDFGREFARICKTLGEDLQGFVRICETLGEISKDL